MKIKQTSENCVNGPIQLADYPCLEEDAKIKNGRFFKIIGSTLGPIEERSYLFRFDQDTFGPLKFENYFSEKFHQESMLDFPAVRSRPCVDLSPGGEYTPYFHELGYRQDSYVLDQEGNQIFGTFVVLPGPELTAKKIQLFLNRHPEISSFFNTISVQIVKGVASDEDFIHAHLKGTLVISPDKEFQHDHFNHLLTELEKIIDHPAQSKLALERFQENIPKIYDRILKIKNENRVDENWSDEEKNVVLLQINPCLTLLSAVIDDYGKFYYQYIRKLNYSQYLNFAAEGILGIPPWKEYFIKRYGAEFDAESVLRAFSLLTSV